MTGHTGLTATEGTPLISAADVARMQAEEELHAEWQRKAVRVVAASSHGADDCRLLLSILGIEPGVIAAARHRVTNPAASKPARTRREQAA